MGVEGLRVSLTRALPPTLLRKATGHQRPAAQTARCQHHADPGTAAVRAVACIGIPAYVDVVNFTADDEM